MIYKFSVYENDQSFGDQLQNLKYRNEWKSHGRHNSYLPQFAPTKTQKLIHAFLSIGVTYIWMRLSRTSVDRNWGEMSDDKWQKKLWKIIHYSEKYFKIINLINFLIFLYNGK